jgi:hypothetical protein
MVASNGEAADRQNAEIYLRGLLSDGGVPGRTNPADWKSALRGGEDLIHDRRTEPL